METTDQKYELLKAHLREMGSAAIAYSGGVDSTFLLAAAAEALPGHFAAIRAVSVLFSQGEQAEAAAYCAAHHVREIVIETDPLSVPGFRANPSNRCYICKLALFQAMSNAAKENHFAALCEGSNADDMQDYRPGMQAVRELNVRSPLLEAGLTKAEIRMLSRELHLPTWNKPSAACLASRLPYGEPVDPDKLRRIAQAEEYLHGLGFRQCRVRVRGADARIEVLPADFLAVIAARSAIDKQLRTIGFSYISLDLQGYRTGSFNEELHR